MRFGFPTIIVGSLMLAVAGFLLTKGLPSNPPPPASPLSQNPYPDSPLMSQLDMRQQQGFALVTIYCADCHAVGLTGDSMHPPAPKFRELYQRFDVTFLEEALVEGLVAHPDMPEFEFDADQANDIIQYLVFLQNQ